MNVESSENERAQRLDLESEQDVSSYGDRKAANMNMEQEQHPHSHLFTLRVWEEALGEGKAEWRGRVHQVASGETLFFRDWAGLIATLRRMIAKTEAARQSDPGQPMLTHENDG